MDTITEQVTPAASPLEHATDVVMDLDDHIAMLAEGATRADVRALMGDLANAILAGVGLPPFNEADWQAFRDAREQVADVIGTTLSPAGWYPDSRPDVGRLDWMTQADRDVVARALTTGEFVLMMNAARDHAPRGSEGICAEDGTIMAHEDHEEMEINADAHQLAVVARKIGARPRHAVGDIVIVPPSPWEREETRAEVTEVRRLFGKIDVRVRYLDGAAPGREVWVSESMVQVAPAE